MPIPTKITDLSVTASVNSPAGSDAVGTSLDDYLRALSAIIRRMYSLGAASIASAATVDIGATDAESVEITGAVTITNLGTVAAGVLRECRFAGALVLTHSANIQLPNAANITTAAGDAITFRSLGGGQWLMVNRSRPVNDLAGAALLAGAAFTGPVTLGGISAGYLGMPTVTKDVAYSYALTDAGFAMRKTGATAQTYTINNAIFSGGEILGAINDSASGTITIAQGAGVTLYLAGTSTTGNRTIAARGYATVYMVSATVGYVTGPGVT